MTISIIIPTYNEQDTISELLCYLKKNSCGEDVEIIVVDGGSSDKTLAKVAEFGGIGFESSQKRWGAQMNAGAKRASGDILYFVHADSTPPPTFIADIKTAVEGGHPAGCFRFQFNSDHPLLKINAYCTRFDRIMCRGGDQTLYITKPLFNRLGGYRDDFIIMEDYDLIERIQNKASFKIIPKNVIVSARKYEQNNYLKVQAANFVVFMMYFWGCSQEKLHNTYAQLLSLPKF